jgi:quinoprotein glucose dehydrogenase
MNQPARVLRGIFVSATLAVSALITEWAPQAQQPQPYTTWHQYAGSSDSMQYSALAQINKNNVTQLQRAWFYPVPGNPHVSRSIRSSSTT